jgi:hypothetical protein
MSLDVRSLADNPSTLAQVPSSSARYRSREPCRLCWRRQRRADQALRKDTSGDGQQRLVVLLGHRRLRCSQEVFELLPDPAV